MSGTSIRSHSLTLDNCRYLDGIAKGHKSAAVNSALTWYRGQGVEIHELLANIEGLQNVIAELYQEELVDEPPGPVAPYSSPQRWPRRVINALKRLFHL